jgi:hypothetical protein
LGIEKDGLHGRGQLMKSLSLHGDNIVECERTWELLKQALVIENGEVLGVQGCVPVYYGESALCGEDIVAWLFPGFGRWDTDIIGLVDSWGGVLREAPDIILCGRHDEPAGECERPLLAIEYCSALDAGNQAWQRCGRAYSYLRAGLPYIYMTELGGYELDADRNPKAPRWPSPVVPFAYALASLGRDSVCLPAFVPSPVSLPDEELEECYGLDDLIGLIRSIMADEDPKEFGDALAVKAVHLTDVLSARRRRQDTFRPPQWSEWLSSSSRLDYLLRQDLEWGKRTKSGLATESARGLMDYVSSIAVGAGASSVPICLLSSEARGALAERLEDTYGTLTGEFRDWINEDRPLGMCWVMGFKPRGDDARPDRGLPPLARMLLGEDADLLTVVYGPAPIEAISLFQEDPIQVARENGLWQAIVECSDGVLLDTPTVDSSIRHTAFCHSHWHRAEEQLQRKDVLRSPSAIPTEIGEHDIDTFLRLFMCSECEGVFEGLCNPPGGDWSGISLVDPLTNTEHRWLSLPRVTQESKRPDHIFQITKDGESQYVVSVESKSDAGRIRAGIGEQLVSYMLDLMRSASSAIRELPEGRFRPNSDGVRIPQEVLEFVSSAAVLEGTTAGLEQVGERLAVDIVFGLSFTQGEVHLLGLGCTEAGEACLRTIECMTTGTVPGFNLEIIT